MTQSQSQDKVIENPGTNLISIRDFAQICRTTPRTIRFYDQKDLLKPKYIDKWTNYRYYDVNQVREFLMIRFMQNFHIPLSQIKLNLQIKSNDLYLKERLDLLKNEVEERRKEIDFLENIHTLFFEDKNIRNVFKKEEIGPFYLFGRKFDNTSYDLINTHREEVRLVAKKLGIGFNQDIVIYLDSKFKPRHSAIEVYVICDEVNFKPNSFSEKYMFKEFQRINSLTYEYLGPELYFIIIYQRLFYLLNALNVNIKNYNFDIYDSLKKSGSIYDFRAKLVFPIK